MSESSASQDSKDRRRRRSKGTEDKQMEPEEGQKKSRAEEDQKPGEERSWANASEHLATNEVDGIDYGEEDKDKVDEDVPMTEPPTEKNLKEWSQKGWPADKWADHASEPGGRPWKSGHGSSSQVGSDAPAYKYHRQGGGKEIIRKGDWVCKNATCTTVNYHKRKECPSCGARWESGCSVVMYKDAQTLAGRLNERRKACDWKDSAGRTMPEVVPYESNEREKAFSVWNHGWKPDRSQGSEYYAGKNRGAWSDVGAYGGWKSDGGWKSSWNRQA